MQHKTYGRAIGAAIAVFGIVTTSVANAAGGYNIHTIHAFQGASAEGRLPVGALALDGQGNLYGSTQFGGTFDQGSLFQYNIAGGNYTQLASFNAGSNNAQQPFGGIIRDASGNLYGTTTNVGSSQGILFKYTPGSGLSTLGTFVHSTTGDDPRSKLAFDSQGNLYGTASTGGANGVYGNIFKYNSTNGLTDLANFNFTNGSHAVGGIVIDNIGNIYGASSQGGTGFGTLFKYTAGANTLTSLYNFNATSPNGFIPGAGLITDGVGNFYGTTTGGGGAGKAGTLFKYNTISGIQFLASFDPATTGYQPRVDLVLDGQGNLFGTTAGNGISNSGTVFKYSASNGLETLATFNGTNGSTPLSPLVIDSSGNLFGTAYTDGNTGNGTIFELSPDSVITATPEPSVTASFAAGILGLGALIFRARRRKNLA